jgi:hypothetical protein
VEHVLVGYGVHRFLADIDEHRCYRGEGGVVGAVLNQLATFGFHEYFEQHDFPHESARQYRERHLIELLKAKRHE